MPAYHVPEFHRLTPASEIEARIRRFQADLADLSLDAAWIVYPVDLFYFTGSLQNGHLLIPVEGEPLYLVRRDPDRARAESPLAEVEPLASLRELAPALRARIGRSPKYIGLELDVLPVNLFKRYQEFWTQAKFVDVSPQIMKLRAVKSAHEIDRMKAAGRLAESVYARVPEYLQSGRTEIEVAGMMTVDAYRGGHQNQLRMRAFDLDLYTWHIISGRSGGVLSAVDAAFGGYGLSPAFPMGASEKVIQAGEPILIDFGICIDGYQIDQTRMFSIGTPPDKIIKAYEAMVRIESEILRHFRPGTPCEYLFDIGMATAESLGYGDSFLGTPGHKTKFLGHGVGMEINEQPVLTPGRPEQLQAGMTIALELKMVFPELGAVGLENTVLVTDHGPEKLTRTNEEYVNV